MSLERRQYNARTQVSLADAELLPVVVEWDEEASHRAIMQAQQASVRDPEASQYLAGQVLAQPVHPAVNVYDPPRLYTQMLLVAGLKKWEIDQMHFVHFFAQVREVILAKERESRSFNEQNPQYQPIDE
jgi:hypothetical protein